MIETLQLEEAVPVVTYDAPKLLVPWSSRWQGFRESIKPALAHSEARLAGEAPFGLIPLRIMVPSYVVEAFLILAAILVPIKIQQLRPYVAPRISPHEVIYYSGEELPRTEDLGGAESGNSGRAGGQEAYHRTQTIKIARGNSLLSTVVDAPSLKLPASSAPVANLLAIRPNLGPPPTEGMRSSRSAPNLAATIVAPAPNVIRDYTRNGVQLDSVIAPAPRVTRDRPLTAPSLSTTLIAPPPTVSNEHTLVAPVMVPAVIQPAPRISRERTQAPPAFPEAVVAPAPTVSSNSMRSAQTLASNVIPPAPGALPQQTRAPVQMTDTNVVPPPVSAPQRNSSHQAQLTMPPPAVVAPPPSADLSGDMRRLAPGASDNTRSVVPPPPTQTGSGSFMSSLIGKIFGATEVVPPPPSVNGTSATTTQHSLASNVVPPPPSVSASSSGTSASGSRNGSASSLNPNVVAPPPSIAVPGGTGTRAHAASAPYVGNPSVVPPPPSLPGAGGGTGPNAGGAGAANGTLLANNVVPPPPSVGGNSAGSSSGTGRKGVGLGAPLNVGGNLAQPSNGGSGGAGAVISSQPGPRVGLPLSGATGSLAMSPAGADTPGLGGSGNGSGIGVGSGSGSGMNGSRSGAGRSGSGRGSDTSARGGISPTSGEGGAGNAAAGNPPVRGVDISGGTGVINLPSFGSDPAGSADPSLPGRSSMKAGQTLGVTIMATATSGGPFAPYKSLLHGETYSTYFDTTLGNVVMQFADESVANGSFRGEVTAPAPLRTDLAAGLPHARMVVACVLDASGNLSNVRVLEPGPATMTAKVVSALRSWKFQPAMRNNQPVQVRAILGFGIDTNDRF